MLSLGKTYHDSNWLHFFSLTFGVPGKLHEKFETPHLKRLGFCNFISSKLCDPPSYEQAVTSFLTVSYWIFT